MQEFILEIFFPSFCLGCQQEGTLLCQDCQATLDISEYNYCLCNKNPLRLPPENTKGTCGRCQGKKLSGLYSALPYGEKQLTRKLIHQFKYEPYIKNLAKPLAKILITHFLATGNNKDDIWENRVLVPVPMEIAKQKKRGYNQTQELAKELGHSLNVLTIPDNLVKTRQTPPQIELSAKDRAQNLANAFAIKNPAGVAGKKIFLVDDVYTTGSTMEECAGVLLDAGAKSIFGIAIARES